MTEEEVEKYAQDTAMYYESTHSSIPSQFEKYLREAVEYGYNKAMNELGYRISSVYDEGFALGRDKARKDYEEELESKSVSELIKELKEIKDKFGDVSLNFCKCKLSSVKE